ncbi:unnamed protein product [Ascophyllum nodosum]
MMMGRAHPREMQTTGCLRDSAGRLRRGGGIEGGVPRCAPLSSSNLVPFGRCGDTREAGSIVAESLVALQRVGAHHSIVDGPGDSWSQRGMRTLASC